MAFEARLSNEIQSIMNTLSSLEDKWSHEVRAVQEANNFVGAKLSKELKSVRETLASLETELYKHSKFLSGIGYIMQEKYQSGQDNQQNKRDYYSPY